MVEKARDIDGWLREVAASEDAVLPTNLGSLPSERRRAVYADTPTKNALEAPRRTSFGRANSSNFFSMEF